MALVSEEFHKKKLDKFGINIKTNYIVGHNILERNTDNSKNDDIEKGIRLEKKYYVNGVLKHKEKDFDSRIEYTFVSKKQEENMHKCPNCGMESKLGDFLDGCPYCGTYYNIDYVNKDLGSKYHYDHILKSNKYRITTAIVDLILSFILSFIFILLTSRTFNSYDFAKVFIYGGILSIVLYYFFYIIDAYIVLGPIKRYKDEQNQKQKEFWSKTKIDKNKFFNNLNYELRKSHYKEENIIDYDVIDYIEFKDFLEDNSLCISVTADVRIVYISNGKIYSKANRQEYVMKKLNVDVVDLKEGANLIKCSNCGAPININDGICSYCRNTIKYLQEWILVEKKDN